MKLLSIVIPTRNREYYCIATLKNILVYKRYDFEIVICDNSDTTQIEEYINNNPDHRIVYKHIEGRINSAINMDYAMRMASGEYVCMIGDDDAVLPEIFEIAEWAKENSYENVTSRTTVSYSWPVKGEKNGTLSWQSSSKGVISKRCDKQIENFVKNGMTYYYSYLMRVYHGLTKRSVLQEVLNRTGHIIGGLSPDIYMAVACSCITEKFILIDRPFTIAGACPKSYTARDGRGEIKWRLEDNPQFYKRGPYIWDERVPAITTSQTIWADTAMHAFEEMQRTDLIKGFNQGRLFADMLRKNPHIIGVIFNKIKQTRFVYSTLYTYYSLMESLLVRALKSAIRKFSKKSTDTIMANIEDIDSAVKAYISYSKKTCNC